MHFDLSRRLFAEWLGTAFLVSAVVGSGIMADRLTDDGALALLCNAIATGAMLIVLIAIVGPISGAHLNPAVSLVFAFRRELPSWEFPAYVVAQIVGAMFGVIAAHAMFGLPMLDIAATVRTGTSQWFAEFVATFGLLAVILSIARFDHTGMPWLVGLYIAAAYWFTSSTSFANPAIAIARSMTNTFSGIRPVDVPAFVIAELGGAMVALAVMGWLLRPRLSTAASS